MQQASKQAQIQDWEWEWEVNIKKAYNDVNLSHFDIKKDVINLSEFAKVSKRSNKKE